MANGEAPGRSANVVPPWSKYPWRDHPLCVLAGGTVLALAGIVALIWPITDWIAAHDVGLITGPTRAAALQVARESVRTQLLTLGAGVFAAGALIFTARNFRLAQRTVELTQETLKLTEQGQVTDRYTRAIEQLGSEELDVRLGSVYALERIARDSRKDHATVMEVLAAFVRERSREEWLTVDPESEVPYRTTRPDVQAAVTVIGRNGPHSTIDLRRAVLPWANLGGAHLRGAYLDKANLDHANLRGADLRGASMSTFTSLRGTSLDGADLRDATLINADFSYAEFGNVKLLGASLAFAHLNDADLRNADLSGVDLSRADFTQALWPNDADPPPGWNWNSIFPDRLARIGSNPELQETDVPDESRD